MNSTNPTNHRPLRFAMFGCGYWAKYQLAAWQEVAARQELDGVECVALYNRTRGKAENLAANFSVPTVYDDAEKLLRSEKLDFVDIVTDRARIDMISGFPVFENQPFFRELEQMILSDMGSHILDTARFLFGEAESLTCQTHTIHRGIRGEDVATVVMSMNGGKTTVTCNMAYAGNALERECFPQTLIFIEGSKGSLELLPDYWVHETTAKGTEKKRWPPVMYPWVDPDYAIVQSSIVDCHADLLRGLREQDYQSETCAEDNLKTLRLVADAYESAEQSSIIRYSNGKQIE